MIPNVRHWFVFRALRKAKYLTPPADADVDNGYGTTPTLPRNDITHDLRSSLRAITIYSELVRRELATDADMDNLEKFSNAIADAAEAMSDQLAELVDLAGS